MFTLDVYLREDLALAIQKMEFEARMAQNKVVFMLDQHLNDSTDDWLNSDQYQDLLSDFSVAYFKSSAVMESVIDLVAGKHVKESSFQFSDNYRHLVLTSKEAITCDQQYLIDPTTVQRKFTSFTDFIAKCYPEASEGSATMGPDRVLTRTVTFQVTDKCNLACTYCYQINKSVRRMKFEDAKLFVDKLLSGEDGFSEYVSVKNSPGIVIEFIGGEPFLEVDLIDQIVDYFRLRTIELNHPWADKFCISICSNGVLYTDPKVQKFLQKNKDCISFSVTLDGNKELHDACRVFPDGRGSYDLAEYATQDWMNRGYYMGSKITISPDNLPYIYDALMHIVGLGYTEVNANCVYEAEWTDEQAGQLYHLMKKFADFMLSDNKYKLLDCSLYQSTLGHPKEETDLQNWCGGTGSMLSMDPDGWLFPCIRYMESSLGASRAPMRIGNVHTGLATCQKDKDCVACLNAIDRRTQSTDECFYCPIAEGCSWCSAWNYQKYGTADHRDTNICKTHRGRVLANVYYWNQYYKKYKIPKVFDLWVPKQWAVPIIGREEYNYLVNLVKSLGGYVNESDTEVREYKAADNN
jgi:radical SAM peptide maturase (CXXX-repeat target family)